jgi:hypothetical protein
VLQVVTAVGDQTNSYFIFFAFGVTPSDLEIDWLHCTCLWMTKGGDIDQKAFIFPALTQTPPS